MSSGLEQFVLDYFTRHEALVERPEYGVVEALLPEAEARRLGCDSFLTLTFAEEVAQRRPGLLYLTIAHPLIERMIEAARLQGQVMQWFVDGVRLQKADLFAVVKQEMNFANAWLSEQKSATERPQVHYYAHFNFKVAFVSDEKQEEIVALLMDVNRGVSVTALEGYWDRLPLTANAPRRELNEAPLLWAPELSPLSQEALELLLPKAANGLAQKLSARLATLQRRNNRLLELDLARLTEFYDSTEHDLERRLHHANDEARAENLRSKLAFAQADRARKLADVREKHRLRLNLDLLNLALIAQPKLALSVWVENRYGKRLYDFVWDPVLHTLEPPLCAVCQEPFKRLHLCANGHFMCDAHTLHCELCKREFCQLCQASLDHCASCGRVICTSSQIHCKICNAVTCADHQRHPHV